MNPVVPTEHTDRYDVSTAGIDYGIGKWHSVTDTHRVWCTDAEFHKWTEGEESK